MDKIEREYLSNRSVIDRLLASRPDPNYTDALGIPFALTESLLPHFRTMFHGKCAYCEQIAKHPLQPCLDYWRPERNAIRKDKEVERDCYTWLGSNKENLYFACTECVRYRMSLFFTKTTLNFNQIQGKDIEFLNREEEPLLLDPCKDNPWEHLGVDLTAVQSTKTLPLTPLSEKGAFTIDAFQLNRYQLAYQRARVFRAMKSEFENLSPLDRYLSQYFDVKAEFRGVLRLCLFKLLEERNIEITPEWTALLGMQTHSLPKLTRATKKKIDQIKETLKNTRTYELLTLTSIKIENFRGLRSLPTLTLKRSVKRAQILPEEQWQNLDLEGDEPLASCLMFLGNNRNGKTAILQAIALALISQEELESKLQRLDERGKPLLCPENLIFGQEDEAKISLTWEEDGMATERRITRNEILPCSGGHEIYLLGYGCTRVLERVTEETPPRTAHTYVQGLFEDAKPMSHVLKWLEDLEEERFHNVIQIIKKVLPDQSIHLFREEGKGTPMMAQLAFMESIPLHCLSEGYKSLIGLVAEILWLHDKEEEPQNMFGIVLIDELDAHLHPSWSRVIVPRLRSTFPRLNFIFTSHDVHCLRGMASEEVYYLWRYGGDTYCEQWRADIRDTEDAHLMEHFQQFSSRNSGYREAYWRELFWRRQMQNAEEGAKH